MRKPIFAVLTFLLATSTFATDLPTKKYLNLATIKVMVAAAEAAVGLAIIIAVFRARSTLAVDRIDLMKL